MKRDKQLIRKAAGVVASLHNRVVPRHKFQGELLSDLPAEREILEFMSAQNTAISDNLQTIFWIGVRAAPRSIVELGVRSGDSTFVFERVVDVSGGYILSADIEDCASTSSHERRFFVQEDDISLAARFREYCRSHELFEEIDLLFIDTSHEYEHTKAEIAAWFPLLSDRAVVVFHDTNLTTLNKRKTGSYGLGWDNQRGVIRALEEYLGVSVDETRDFMFYRRGWLVEHHAHSSGLTVLSRIGAFEGGN